MIYHALLVPSEFAPTSLQVKRALLTFDKVLLVSPDDRDLIPGTVFMSAVCQLATGHRLPFGGDPGVIVRPLGKGDRYDDGFDSLLNEIRPAQQASLVEVISTYDHAGAEAEAQAQGFVIGTVPIPTGGYPLNPAAVLHLFVTASQQQDLLKCVVDRKLLDNLPNQDAASQLALGGSADGQFNLPPLDLALPDERLRTPLSQIARARIATAIKMTGYCEQKSIVPLFGEPGYCALVQRLLANTSSLLAAFGQETHDPFWLQLNTVLSAVNNEFLDEEALSRLTIGEVIRLRTKAWGRQAAAREQLFESIQRIAEESKGTDTVARNLAVAKAVAEYRKVAEDIENERRGLVYRVAFDMAGAMGSMTLAGGAALVAQVGSPLGAAMTLGAGIAWAAQQLPKWGPELNRWRQNRQQFQRGAGFALNQFYSNFKAT